MRKKQNMFSPLLTASCKNTSLCFVGPSMCLGEVTKIRRSLRGQQAPGCACCQSPASGISEVSVPSMTSHRADMLQVSERWRRQKSQRLNSFLGKPQCMWHWAENTAIGSHCVHMDSCYYHMLMLLWRTIGIQSTPPKKMHFNASRGLHVRARERNQNTTLTLSKLCLIDSKNREYFSSGTEAKTLVTENPSRGCVSCFIKGK